MVMRGALLAMALHQPAENRSLQRVAHPTAKCLPALLGAKRCPYGERHFDQPGSTAPGLERPTHRAWRGGPLDASSPEALMLLLFSRQGRRLRPSTGYRQGIRPFRVDRGEARDFDAFPSSSTLTSINVIDKAAETYDRYAAMHGPARAPTSQRMNRAGS
jgi:hypothetical protein